MFEILKEEHKKRGRDGDLSLGEDIRCDIGSAHRKNDISSQVLTSISMTMRNKKKMTVLLIKLRIYPSTQLSSIILLNHLHQCYFKLFCSVYRIEKRKMINLARAHFTSFIEVINSK